MGNVYKKYRVEELICYSAFIILFAAQGMGEVSSSKILKLITVVAYALFVIKLAITVWTPKSLIGTIYLNLLGLLIAIYSGRFNVFFTIMMITSLKDIDVKKVMKVCFWSYIVFFLINILFVSIGLNESQLMYNLDDSIRKRYGLGYGHPNTTQSIVFTITCLCLIGYKDKLKTYHFLLMMIFNVVMYQFTDSRTGMLLTTLVILGTYGLHLMQQFKVMKYVDFIGENKIIKFIISNISIIIAIIVIVASVRYSQYEDLQCLGTVASRIIASNKIINASSITLFGQPEVTTDLGYVYMLYKYGIIFWGLWLITHSMLLKQLLDNKLYRECIIVLCFVVYAVIENFTTVIGVNITLMFMSFILYPTNLLIYKQNNILDSQA